MVFDESKVNLHQIQNHKVRDEMKSCYSIKNAINFPFEMAFITQIAPPMVSNCGASSMLILIMNAYN